MSKVRDFAEKKDTSISDVILKATKSSVFRINEKLHNGKQGFALTKKGFTPRPPPQCKASSLTYFILVTYFSKDSEGDFLVPTQFGHCVWCNTRSLA